MGIIGLTVIVGGCVFLIALITVAWVASPGSKPKDLSEGENKRAIRRFANSDEVILSWLAIDNVTQTLKCRLIDISEHSVGVRSNLALGLGTFLHISIPNMRLVTTANVRRCAKAGRKFDLGLEFRGPLYRQ
jgi:PilZ domain